MRPHVGGDVNTTPAILAAGPRTREPTEEVQQPIDGGVRAEVLTISGSECLNGTVNEKILGTGECFSNLRVDECLLQSEVDEAPHRPMTEPVTAGDLKNLVSDGEIDYFLGAALGERTFPARRFYDFQRKELANDHSARRNFRDEIESKLRRFGWIMFPVWTRHHWATALLVASEGLTHITIYDSAAHPMTAHDYEKRFKALGYSGENVRTIQHAKQPPRSDECGLHPILLALIAEAKREPPILEQTMELLDLNQWRQILSRHLERGSLPKLEEVAEFAERKKPPHHGSNPAATE